MTVKTESKIAPDDNASIEARYGGDEMARKTHLASLPPNERADAALAYHEWKSEAARAERDGKPAPPKPSTAITPAEQLANVQKENARLRREMGLEPNDNLDDFFGAEDSDDTGETQ